MRAIIATGSRDKSAKLWRIEGQSLTLVREFHSHTHFVNAVAFAPANDIFPDGLTSVRCGLMDSLGLLLSAGSDKSIQAHSLTEPFDLVLNIDGAHTDNICRLVSGSDGRFISCSWDKYEF